MKRGATISGGGINGKSSSLLEGLAIRSRLEVARIIGTSRQNVEQTEHRAFKKIRRALGGAWRDLQSKEFVW